MRKERERGRRDMTDVRYQMRDIRDMTDARYQMRDMVPSLKRLEIRILGNLK